MNSSITPLPFDRPARPARPARLARPAGRRSRVASVGAWFRQTLATAGKARARAHLLDFAERCEASQPELAKELRSAGNRMLMG